MFSPEERRLAAMLDALPRRLHAVHRWQGWREPRGAGHLHHVPTLVLAVQGPVEVRRSGTRLRLGTGEAVVIAPGVWHFQEPVDGDAVAWMQGLLPAGSDIQFWLSGGRRRDGGVAKEPASTALAAMLAEDDGAARLVHLRGLVEAVLRSGVEPMPVPSPAMTRMIEALWSGAHRGATARDIVLAARLSRSRAYELFKAHFGESMHRALLAFRAGLAESLVRSGLSTDAAARLAGFSGRNALARRRRIQRRNGQAPRPGRG